MVSIEECYLRIVGKEPNKDENKLSLVEDILRFVEANPKDIDAKAVSLFLVDIFMSGYLDNKEILKSQAIGVVKIHAIAQGCNNVERMSISHILAWMVDNTFVD